MRNPTPRPPVLWTRLSAMERLPDGARLEKGHGGLERLVLSALDGEAVVYLQGAHVAHFQPRGGNPPRAAALAGRSRTARRLPSAPSPTARIVQGRIRAKP